MQPRGRSDEDPVAALERELRRNVTRYQEYNASTCAEFVDETPSALEFHRFVASNRPVVLRRQGYRDQVPALDKWTDEYLVDKMEQRLVDISVDPTGNADSIVQGYFVEPATVPMTMEQLFSQLRHEDEARTGGDKEEDEAAQRPVFYLQSQNGNLSSTGEYASLLNDVGSEGPSWAREAFGQSPDVANIWIGGDRSKTSVHKDPYENIYLVVRGAKDFLLWPPSEAYCMHEQKYPHASWSYDPAATAATTTTRDDKDGFKLVPTEPRVSIPWIPIDPLVDSTSRHPRYALARAMHVRLEQGDMLYLPACWYHHVSQSGGYFHQNVEDKKTRGAENEGRRAGTGTKATIAVNWWFDMKFDGHFYSSLELNRRLVKALDRAQSRRRQREMRDGTSDRLEPSRMFLREEEAGHRDEDETSLDSDDSTR